MAGEIMKLFAKESVATSSKETNKDSEAKEDKEKKEKEQRWYNRGIVKNALRVLAVAGGIAAGVAVAGTPLMWAGPIAAVVTSFGEGIAKGFGDRYMRQQNEVLNKRLEGELDKAEKVKVESLKNKEKWARGIANVLKQASWFTIPFGVTSAINALFKPDITSLVVEITGKWTGTVDKLQLLRETIQNGAPFSAKIFNFGSGN